MTELFIDNATPEQLVCAMVEEQEHVALEGMAIVRFIDRDKKLKRWGGDFVIVIKNGEIITNSLIERAWNNDLNKAVPESNNAIRFFARQMLDKPWSLQIDVWAMW